MDEQTLTAIAQQELERDIRRAEARARFLGLLQRNGDGTLTTTDEGTGYVMAIVRSQPTLH